MKKITTAALAAATIATAANITVDPSATKQEIIGFRLNDSNDVSLVGKIRNNYDTGRRKGANGYV